MSIKLSKIILNQLRRTYLYTEVENILSDRCNQSSRQVPYCMFHCCDMDLEYMDSYWLQVNKTRDYCDSDQLLKVLWPAQQKLKTESSGTERAFFGISKYPNFRDLLTGVWINLTFLLEFLEFLLLFYSHQLESSARYDWMESALTLSRANTSIFGKKFLLALKLRTYLY